MGSKLGAAFAVVRGLVSLAVLLGFALVRFVLEKVGLVKALGADEKQPYLEGNWGPVDDEVKIDNLEIVGEIPKHLDGEFVRNGPNPQFKEQVYKNYHWFDGDGMLHGVRLENGKATYVNRWVRTERFEQERKAKRPLHVLLGQMRNAPTFLASALFNQVLIALHLRPKLSAGGTANTALTYHDGHLLALVENDVPTVIKLPYLETLGRHNYDGKLTHPFTAHPKVDAETGECMFFGYRFDKKPYVCYSLINNKGELVSTVGINAVDVPVMMHDFAVTKHYSIIMNLPFTFRIERLFNGEPLFQFEEDRKSKFGIIPRHARREEEIIWFEAKPGFVFHTANAWEEGDEIVLVACRSKATSSLGLSKDDVDYSDKYRTNLYEWRFNLKSRGVKERYLDNLRVEFPVVNESLIGVKCRYTYTAHFIEDPMPYMDGVVKYDLQQNTSDGKLKPKVFLYGDNKFGGECLFVPAHKPTSEDDGFLITYVYDEVTQKSELWIIDAKTMETVVARVKIPRRIPFGFHGKWVTQDQIVNQKPFPVLRS